MPYKDPDKRREFQRRYSKTDKAKARIKKYRQTVRGKASQKIISERYENSETAKNTRKRYRESKNGNMVYNAVCKRFRDKRRTDIIKLLGDKCVLCGYYENRFGLDIDHKNGGGRLDRARFKSRTEFYIYYLGNPEEAKDKLQLLCGTCHNIKTRSKR